ncbi:superinfection immunity protein [Streptomyces sp. G44]|uniref:superinfection immunity protein n=1 Tax=Streptomyces sp. G44 TaxID=2807632 RepID=UPI00196170B9|nr:superinfection immunity protein [Streptomyces sp. G44]MBM7167944.1 superinfection immunity protein [Streptomyces sp. G44]
MFDFGFGFDLGFGADLGSIGGLTLAILTVALCVLPSLIAFNRGIELRWVVLVLNVAAGSSLIAWLVALYLATRKPQIPLAPSAPSARNSG